MQPSKTLTASPSVCYETLGMSADCERSHRYMSLATTESVARSNQFPLPIVKSKYYNKPTLTPDPNPSCPVIHLRHLLAYCTIPYP